MRMSIYFYTFDFDTFKNDTFKSVIFRYSHLCIILALLEKILILTLSRMTSSLLCSILQDLFIPGASGPKDPTVSVMFFRLDSAYL